MVHLRSDELPEEAQMLGQDDIEETLEDLGVPKRYRKDITGVAVLIGDGDYDAIWLCEDSRPWTNNATYSPLPYYRARIPKFYPSYWQKKCPFYSGKEIVNV